MNSRWIHTDNLSRHYRRGDNVLRAIDGVSIEIAQGEALAVVGKSGSGKTTLLNLIAGLDTPTAGHVSVDGKRLADLSPKELSAYRAGYVGMIFQAFNLLPHQTALRNVELPLYFIDTPKRERRKLATETLERLGLGDRLDHRPGDLSGGEQQRVAVARALVKRPKILLADEPTGNLDRENSLELSDLLCDLNRDGLTMIIVTHDLEIASRTASRTLRMDYGRIVGENGSEKGGAS